MQTQQTVNEGLKRAYLITIPAGEIAAKIDAEIKKVAPQVRMPGFRPGKVPANLVKKMHGEALHGQVVNDTIRESVDTLIRNEALRPAMQPEIGLNEDYAEGKDAAITVTLEVLPAIEAPSTEGLKLERLVVPVTDEQIDEALGNIASQNKSYKDAPKTKKAAEGDQLIIDFVGKLDGVEFDGGKAEDAALVLGSNTFIPGFEDQLVGVKAGQEKTITVTFPAEYQAEHLAGKEATFDITVKAVKVEGETTLDEDFAKSLGLDSLEKLREIMKAQLEQQTSGLTRTQMKRQLLDQLAAGHSFEVPGTMVEAEFQQIWAQLQQEAARDENPAEALKQIEDEKDEYRSIAERRVRLGLLLAEIGQAARLFLRLLLLAPEALRRPALVRDQVHFLGNYSLAIIVVSGLFVGFVLGLQGYYILDRFGSSEASSSAAFTSAAVQRPAPTSARAGSTAARARCPRPQSARIAGPEVT